ncbi:glycoside hydrolase family protein [Cedecea lapagei]|uniref:glycoside hydrolase family protein n=1 Tax=Cedecea lapagei TaxID=158823 RepID=UPI001BCAA802|nr:glycoside hydrolase family protein [Cedecea lapagei]
MDLKSRLKVYEGTQSYQQSRGIFRNGKFYPYKDHLGYLTVGFGHLVLKGENYDNGLTPTEADVLLDKDISTAKVGLKSLGLSVPKDWEDFLIIMIFQLGVQGVRNFRKMIAALQVQNYKEAIIQAKDSLWYKQTPKRVDEMISVLQNK